MANIWIKAISILVGSYLIITVDYENFWSNFLTTNSGAVLVWAFISSFSAILNLDKKTGNLIWDKKTRKSYLG